MSCAPDVQYTASDDTGCAWSVANFIFRSRLLGNFPPVTWLLVVNDLCFTEQKLGETLFFALAEWGRFQVQMNFNLTQKQEKESFQVKIIGNKFSLG